MNAEEPESEKSKDLDPRKSRGLTARRLNECLPFFALLFTIYDSLFTLG